MNKEPAAIVGIIVAFVAAAIALLTAFGLDISNEQKVAILGFAAPAYAIIQAVITRAKVYAPASVDTVVPGTETVD